MIVALFRLFAFYAAFSEVILIKEVAVALWIILAMIDVMIVLSTRYSNLIPNTYFYVNAVLYFLAGCLLNSYGVSHIVTYLVVLIKSPLAYVQFVGEVLNEEG